MQYSEMIEKAFTITILKEFRKIGRSYKDVIEYEIISDFDIRKILKFVVVGSRGDIKCYPTICSLPNKSKEDQFYNVQSGYLISRKNFNDIEQLIIQKCEKYYEVYTKGNFQQFYFKS
jgi:hypothetical protein